MAVYQTNGKLFTVLIYGRISNAFPSPALTHIHTNTERRQGNVNQRKKNGGGYLRLQMRLNCSIKQNHMRLYDNNQHNIFFHISL